MERDREPGRIVFRKDVAFNGVKVFAATIASDRANLGERVTAWLADHPWLEIVEVTVTQSSDAAFHMLAIVIAFRDPRLLASR